MMLEKKTRYVGFTPLPDGWYNYYSSPDGKAYREPCPGIITVELYYPIDPKDIHVRFEFRPATLKSGFVDEARSAPNYRSTSKSVDNWEEA